MNKKEQAAFDALQKERDMAYAFAWPSQAEPKPYTREDIEVLQGGKWAALVKGWWMNPYSATSRMGHIFDCLGEGCTSGHSHSTSHTHKTTTQGMGVFYATKEDAILALRWEVCRTFENSLMLINKL